MTRLPRNTILAGDARERLGELPASSIDCVITSPPYFRLRDYDVAGQIGQERSADDWAEDVRAVMAQLPRVLKPSGSLWLNLGDTYSARACEGALAKSLLLTPERVLLRLLDDGWICRNKAIWHKRNPTPYSGTDRLTAGLRAGLSARTPGPLLLRSRRDPNPPSQRPDSPASTELSWRPAPGGTEPRVAEGKRRGRTPGRQEPGQCLGAGQGRLPRRPLRHLPSWAPRAADSCQLPRARMYPVRGAVASTRPRRLPPRSKRPTTPRA